MSKKFWVGIAIILVIWAVILYAVLHVRVYEGDDVSFRLADGWKVEITTEGGESASVEAESTGYFEVIGLREGCGGVICPDEETVFYGKRQSANCFVADPAEWDSGSIHMMTEGSVLITLACESGVTVGVWLGPDGGGASFFIVTLFGIVAGGIWLMICEEDHRR